MIEQKLDAAAVASAMRLSRVVSSRWVALASVRENPRYTPVSPTSSYFQPRTHVFGRVTDGSFIVLRPEWWSDVFHAGPCDGHGLPITAERRAAARLAAGFV